MLTMQHQRFSSLRFVVLALSLAMVGCPGGGSPQFETIEDQVGQVGSELKLNLLAIDPDGDHLTYRMNYKLAGSDRSVDLTARTQLARTPSDGAIFKWVPLAQDVGDWYFDFVASDGANESTLSLKVTIRSSVGNASRPVKLRPSGNGTPWDLAKQPCVELLVEVDDVDTTEVAFSQPADAVPHGTITRINGTTVRWKWCPTATEKRKAVHTIRLLADDHMNEPLPINYTVSLFEVRNKVCAGETPRFTHSAGPVSGLTDFDLVFDVSDDKKLAGVPELYFARTPLTSNPLETPNLSAAKVTLVAGDLKAGKWKARVPNPVWNDAVGTAATLHYFIVARDDDDAAGDCDHVAVSSKYSTKVTATATADAALCETCQGDRQCGASDLCVRVGAEAMPYCLTNCQRTTDCGEGYICSPEPIRSLGGQMARQCVPVNGACNEAPSVCADDEWEENDIFDEAPEIFEGLYEMASCVVTGDAAADADYYKIKLPTKSKLVVEMAGGPESDLDLTLEANASGDYVGYSVNVGASEKITTACLSPGTYYVWVGSALAQARNTYYLDVDVQDCP